MENEIYSGHIKDSKDNEGDYAPLRVVVTKEANGHAVWIDDAGDIVLHKFFRYESPASVLEFAVPLALSERKRLQQK